MTQDPAPNDRRALLLQALKAVEDMKARLQVYEQQAGEPLAIVGAGCRYPGDVVSLATFWDLLEQGRDAVREIPAARWGAAGAPEGNAVWRAGLVDGLDQFDPRFFGISAREATTMDPQQRMVLEVAWEALEHGGQSPTKLAGTQAGVFIGITSRDYGQIIRDTGRDLLDVYTATGNASNAAAGRLSYFLGLHGPSVSIDTACSSSLVAIHLACQSLRLKECRVALAGGVNAVLTPDPFICFANWGMMAPDGRCKAFDARADGFVRAEGCGIVVLKRLNDALSDGDRILALIRGSAVNQDGRSSGLTVPNGPAQEAVIRQALATARLDPVDVSYVETHGTGTALGDPIEAHALAAVYGPGRNSDNPLVLGSVKTNIGHAESAAGVAGLIKTILALQREFIPAHLHFQRWNPNINWNSMPVELPAGGRPWKRSAKPRRAGVSSFGFSGTNAHLIIEEAPEPVGRRSERERPVHVLTLSARSSAALSELQRRYETALEPLADMADACFTANSGRAHFAERLAIVGADGGEILARLRTGGAVRGRARERDRVKVAFLFTGQGSQYAGMGRELYETQPVFRAALENCAEILRTHLEIPLLDVLYGQRSELLDQTAYTQPALFALEWSLAELWRSWGVEPAVVFGHSVGEYVAACVAGVYPLADGLRLIVERARLMQGLPQGGAMAAVMAPEARVRSILSGAGPGVSVAAVNGPASVVISGRQDEVQAAQAELKRQGVEWQSLVVSHAFHSAEMESISTQFGRLAASVEMRSPQVTVISSVTGKAASLDEFRSSEYWRRQVRDAVQFQAAMEELGRRDYRVFLEVGPAPVLLGMGRQCLPGDEPAWLPSLKKTRGDWPQMLESLAALYVKGAEIDWAGFDAPYARRRLPLPTYPYERQRYWVDETPVTTPATTRHRGTHPLLGQRFDVGGPTETHVWQTEVSLRTHPYLADHCIQERAVFPATAYMEMGFAAARELFGESPVYVEKVEFHKPLFVSEAGARLQVTLTPASSGCAFRIFSKAPQAAGWTLHASGACGVEQDRPETISLPGLQTEPLACTEFYRHFHDRGNNWGPSFQGVQQAWIESGEAWTRIAIPEPVSGDTGYLFHPAVSDACGHGLAAITAFADSSLSARGAFVGEMIGRAAVFGPARSSMMAHARIRNSDVANILLGDVTVYADDGTVLTRLSGARLRYIEASTDGEPAQGSDPINNWFYETRWEPVGPPAGPPAVSLRRWLLIGSDSELAREMSEVIRESGGSAKMVPVEEAGTELAGAGDTGLLFLTAATAGDMDGLKVASAEFLNLAGAVSARSHNAGTRIWMITKGGQHIEGDPLAPVPWQTPLWGLGRTFEIEHGELWGGLVDIDPTLTPREAARSLWAHLAAPGREDQVVLRKDRVFAARLKRVPIAAAAPPRLREDSAYLITGGLGGLGLQVARWAARQGAGAIVLLGRTPLPDESAWDTIADSSPQRDAVNTVRELRSSGVSVEIVAVDIADQAALRSLFDRRRETGLAPIRGVVHAAGVLLHKVLRESTSDDLNRIFRAKVAGAWNLHQATAGEELDFFVLFSSASALLSSPRLGAYAAGNAFLDGLAEYRRALHLPAVSINWGLWKEAGMASRLDRDAVDQLAERGMGGMSTDEGLRALARVLLSGSPSVAVLPVDWAKWAALYPAFAASPFLSSLVSMKGSPGDSGGPSRSTPLDREQCTARLRGMIASIAGFPEGSIEPQLPITDFGLDSLMSLELRNRVSQEFGVAIPMVRFLEGPTVTELASEIFARSVPEAPPSELVSLPVSDEYPLSHGQRALWFIQRLTPESAAYNVALSVRAEPGFDMDTLRYAFSRLVERHPSLRAVVAEADGVLTQRVTGDQQAQVDLVDAAGWSAERLRQEVIDHYRRPFDLSRSLYRVVVFRHASCDVLLVTVHHLVFDAFSTAILFEDLRRIYEARVAGVAPELAPCAAHYRDYVRWQQTMLDQPETERMWDYWRQALSGELPVLRLRGAKTRSILEPCSDSSAAFAVDSQLSDDLRQLARQYKTTLYTVLLAAFQVLLSELSDQEDIIVGSPVSGRGEPRWASVIGYFINLLPIRSELSGDPSFAEHLNRTREKVLGALTNQEFPFPLMVERLRFRRETGQSPIFQAFFNYLTDRGGELGGLFTDAQDCGVRFSTATLRPFPIVQQEGQFQIALEVADVSASLAGTVKYAGDETGGFTAQDIAERYRRLLRDLAAEPNLPLRSLRRHADPEREDILL